MFDFNNLFRDLWCKLRGSENGYAIFTYGKHEARVTTWCTPSKVFVSVLDSDIQVCASEISAAGVQIVDNGFILYADVKSSAACLEWIVQF